MKNFKKIIALTLSLLMLLGCVAPLAIAADDSVTVNICNFNVAGLPNVESWIGKNDVNVSQNQKDIGAYLSSGNFDIVALQEDFSYHKDLLSTLSGFNYQTHHTGSFLGGDGMNIFTKSAPIYNETRIPWNTLHGIIESGADELSNKGILYAVLDLGNGIYVDFYDIHADAYGAQGDLEARKDNYAQLSALINENYAKNNRPVVVVGDFNSFFHTSEPSSTSIYTYFIKDCALKEAWIEVHNGGSYTDFRYWIENYGTAQWQYWGIWESVEKVFYKDGGGVTVTADDFSYYYHKNAKDEKVSDHAAAECTLTFTKTADFVENTQSLTVSKPRNTMFTELIWFLTILMKLLANFDEVLALL